MSWAKLEAGMVTVALYVPVLASKTGGLGKSLGTGKVETSPRKYLKVGLIRVEDQKKVMSWLT